MFCLDEDVLPYPGQEEFAPLCLAHMDESCKKEYWATLALRYCKGIGVRTIAKLLKHFGSAYEALENRRQWQELGISQACISAMGGDAWREGAKKEWDMAAGCDARILLWNCSLYPQRLRQLPDAPALLYCKGDTSLLGGPAVAIVGSRNASSQGRDVAFQLASALAAAGLTIISGMALGIDREAHAAAICQVGKTIGVLGTGIEMEYPVSNRDIYAGMKKTGLLVSEFSPRAPAAAVNFPVRNRIISGLSLAVVVVEATVRSGSLITARQALEQNREVFAVPGQAMNECSTGCQNLIRQGARPVFSAEDILCDLEETLRAWQGGPSPKIARKPAARKFERPKAETPKDYVDDADSLDGDALAATEKLAPNDESGRVLAYLRANKAAHIDSICQMLDITPAQAGSLLIGMEMLGQVRRLPGARYEVCHGNAG